MVWVFKTSVQSHDHVSGLHDLLNHCTQPHGRWTIDLDDCDKVLRVEHDNLEVESLITHLQRAGVQCEELNG
jgi:hypothetical protein